MNKAVGIRELKAHLSRYVREVRGGQEVLVSDRGRIIARLVPVEPPSESARLNNLLMKLSAEGKIVLPRTHKRVSRPSRRKKVKGTSFAGAVLDDRR